VFPHFLIDEIKRQEARDLTRFDVEYDIPDHFLPGGQPVYPTLPVYPQYTRKRRMPSDNREPYRASIHDETPDFTRVLADLRTRADEKEQGRKGQ
jgi:hypothetical protein